MYALQYIIYIYICFSNCNIIDLAIATSEFTFYNNSCGLKYIKEIICNKLCRKRFLVPSVITSVNEATYLGVCLSNILKRWIPNLIFTRASRSSCSTIWCERKFINLWIKQSSAKNIMPYSSFTAYFTFCHMLLLVVRSWGTFLWRPGDRLYSFILYMQGIRFLNYKAIKPKIKLYVIHQLPRFSWSP